MFSWPQRTEGNTLSYIADDTHTRRFPQVNDLPDLIRTISSQSYMESAENVIRKTRRHNSIVTALHGRFSRSPCIFTGV